MDQAQIIEYVSTHCEGVNVVAGTIEIAIGDTFFIYDPERNLPDKQQIPFATIVTKDYGDFDNASNLRLVDAPDSLIGCRQLPDSDADPSGPMCSRHVARVVRRERERHTCVVRAGPSPGE